MVIKGNFGFRLTYMRTVMLMVELDVIPNAFALGIENDLS